MKISDFKQTSKKITVYLDLNSEGSLSVKKTEKVPQKINNFILKGASDVPFSKVNVDNRVKVNIVINDIKESFDTEYSLFILFIGNDSLHYCEIVRQSESYLQEKYNFSRGGGYCILGRRNIHIGAKNQVQHIGLKEYYGYASTSSWEINKELIDSSCPLLEISEIRAATYILCGLTSLPFLTGPTNSNGLSYNNSTFEDQIKMLLNGEYAVQCSGFRDLFVWLACSNGISVRSVDAYNYSPQFDDLITFGHSLCEIYIESTQIWVIFDPWYAGLMILDNDDYPMSTKQLVTLSGEDCGDLSLVATIKRINRNLIDGQGNNYQNSFDPKSVDIIDYTYSKLIPNDLSSIMPGYLNYFHVIRILDVKVHYRYTRSILNFYTTFKNQLKKPLRWLIELTTKSNSQ